MNYEKAYKAVLKTATQWIEDGCSDKEKICLEAIFPELRESEDERIIQELKEAFEAYDIESKWNGIPIRSILAWLEKQKEQKPVEKHDLVAQLKEYLANTPKEQVEAEWEELKKWNDVGPTVEEYFGSIKSAEWSEEDEEEINIISEIIEHCTTIPYSGGTLTLSKEHKKKLQYFIKSLRPQPKQEWSEADETYLQYALWCVEKAEKSCKGEDKGACWSAKRWLKSLRPSWKPSEEQMEALNYAIAEWDGGKRLEGLYTLRNDLRKLM